MKIRVRDQDGDDETLTLGGQWLVREGTELDRIVGSSGRERFFTKEGHYAGWRRAKPCDQWSRNTRRPQSFAAPGPIL